MFHQTLEQSRVSLNRQRAQPDPLLSSLQDQNGMQQQIRELQARNAELDTYALTVAHDFKDPLGTMACLVTLLQEEYAQMSVEKRQAFLKDMTCIARKMGNIVDELLLLAEVCEAEIETELLDMAAIVAEAQARLASMIQDSQAEMVVPAAWSVAQERGAWVNYLSHAIKYGGWLPHAELNAATQLDGRVCFWVRDHGPGITLEDQA